MDFSTLRPVDYTIKQPEFTPLTKRMSDILTLGEMMDKSKANKIALADAERKQQAQEMFRQQAEKELKAYETVPPINTTGLFPPSEPITAAPAPVPAMGFSATAPAISATPGVSMGAGPSTEQLATNFPAPGAPELTKIPGQVLQTQIANQAPENRIPKAYSFLNPNQYESFLRVSKEHPDLGMDYLKNILTFQKTVSEIEKNKRTPTQPYSAKQQQSLEWTSISAMEDGPEKEAAKLDYYNKYAPSVGYNASPAAIEQALKKGVALESGTRPAKVQTAAAVETARTVAGAEAGAKVGTEIAAKSLPGFKLLPGVNVTEADVKAVKGAEPTTAALIKGVQEIRDRYKKVGTKLTGDDAAWYRSKIKALQLLSKGPELYALGVLAGPDMDILTGVLPDPSTLKEGIGKYFLGDLDIKFKSFEDFVRGKSDAFYKIHGVEKEKPAIKTDAEAKALLDQYRR